jgi:hypothetical protein
MKIFTIKSHENTVTEQTAITWADGGLCITQNIAILNSLEKHCLF